MSLNEVADLDSESRLRIIWALGGVFVAALAAMAMTYATSGTMQNEGFQWAVNAAAVTGILGAVAIQRHRQALGEEDVPAASNQGPTDAASPGLSTRIHEQEDKQGPVVEDVNETGTPAPMDAAPGVTGDLTGALADSERRRGDLAAQVESLEDQVKTITEQRDRLADMREELAAAKAERSDFQARTERLQDDLARAIEQRDSFAEQLKDLDSLQRALEDAETRNAELESTRAALLRERDSNEERLEKMGSLERALDEAQARIDDLEAEREQLVPLREQTETMRAHLDAARHENGSLSEALEAQRAEAARLERALEERSLPMHLADLFADEDFEADALGAIDEEDAEIAPYRPDADAEVVGPIEVVAAVDPAPGGFGSVRTI